ncbi:DUF3696 domain-containing protein [Candidatus Palauibacter sp.]|uniref:DUF3696 domain-containing protein n=1 Tax=Candidatus Palauibacter sp. TaxID=3101350 RepID=UPI003C6FB775
MIKLIGLANFKCFEKLELTCAPLTLLCGVNGMGKSSVIQAIMVLRQSFQSGELSRGRLVLSGDLVDLGTGQDVLREEAEEEQIIFELQSARIPRACRLSFEYSRMGDELRTSRGVASPGVEVGTEWEAVPPFGGSVVHVSADRIGPRKFYDRSEVRARQGDLGSRGEYALSFIHAREGATIPPYDARVEDAPRSRLIDVINHWLQEITPGVHLEIQTVQQADAVIAGFSFDRPDDVPSRAYRATNVGFGLSYTLPVLAALFSAKGTLCLVENPEAHLHPRGQTKLGELAVRAALAGVQVVAETHSDHFIDGVRIAVRDSLIAPDSVAIHYFERHGTETVVRSPELDSDGRLSFWPDGFFDQHEKNLARLLAPSS